MAPHRVMQKLTFSPSGGVGARAMVCFENSLGFAGSQPPVAAGLGWSPCNGVF